MYKKSDRIVISTSGWHEKKILKMAERFNLPVVTFIDTPGAYPGINAEESTSVRLECDDGAADDGGMASAPSPALCCKTIDTI